jgi:DNA polymerase eta
VQRDVVQKWLSRVEGELDDHLLACGAVVIAELRLAVLTETGFTCSAGIAHNKVVHFPL